MVTADKDATNIKGFGSGFFFHYKDRLFFVTADHVSHYSDFEAGERLGKDDFIWVLNNKNNTTKLLTMLTPIGELFSFDEIDFEDELSTLIPDMKDISFAMLRNSFSHPFLTHELRTEEQVIVPANEEKLIIKSGYTSELSALDYCIIEGCVQWNIEDGIRISRSNAIHQDLTLSSIDNEGYYNLKYTAPVRYKDWAGLSGGPVFSDKCQLIGMAIEVDEKDDTIKVVPIKKITELMDLAIKYEESIIKKDSKL